MDDELNKLIDHFRSLHEAGKLEIDMKEQAISFAYGNVAIENPAVTKDMVREAMRKLKVEEAMERTFRTQAETLKELAKR